MRSDGGMSGCQPLPETVMRRFVAPIAALAVALSAVAPVIGAEPQPSVEPAPVIEPSVAPTDPQPETTASPTPAVETTARGGDSEPKADPTGRWIVVLKPGTNVATATDRQAARGGFKPDHEFKHAVRGYSAALSRAQVDALRRDPSVALIVPDEKVELTSQLTPTGVARINGRAQTVAKIDGVDQRVDADVAIVDTGIAKVPDLNVAGGYSCANSSTTAWQDNNGHGTHVAGTVGAIDNSSGVVGVAPGVRVWAVKILDDTGEGLLSWYVCGLDWITAQRDPNDASRPLFEAVNMSVAKWGSDDAHCGTTNNDVLHQAICRLVSSGVTVVAAAGNDALSASNRVPAAYNEVITVSALADTDGLSGGKGGHRCFSWGTYDVDDTFADFSNYGSDIDLIAPGKCIWSTVPGGYKYSSGTSMAAPHVTGAAALLKASRPYFTPGEVKEALQYLGTLNWKTSTDPDPYHERLLDVGRIGPRGDFGVIAGGTALVGEAGGPARFSIGLTRTSTFFERVTLGASDLPPGATASFDVPSLYGFAGLASTLTVDVPDSTPAGSYEITITGTEHGRARSATATVVVEGDAPTAQPPSTAARARATLGDTVLPTTIGWAPAIDASSPIDAYEVQKSVSGGAWTAAGETSGDVRTVAGSQTFGQGVQYRVRARDLAGNWSAWAPGASTTSVVIQDRASAVSYSGTWHKYVYANASGGTTTWATSAGARARTTFSGRGVAMVAPVGTTRGSAKIYIDGAYKATISFKASSGKSRVLMYATTFSTLGTHTIDVRLVGDGRVDLDAFVILR